MADTPTLDWLREKIARARPKIIGKLVIGLTATQGAALEREFEQLGVALPDVTVLTGHFGCEVEIDGAAIVWRHG